MEWAELRRHYEQLFNAARKRGETQETIAARGGLRQNKISELLSNDKLGPRAETFLKAIVGLGLRPSQFFAELERSQNPALKLSTSTGQNPASLEGGALDELVSTALPKILYELSDHLLKAADRALVDRPVSGARPAKSERRRSRA